MVRCKIKNCLVCSSDNSLCLKCENKYALNNELKCVEAPSNCLYIE